MPAQTPKPTTRASPAVPVFPPLARRVLQLLREPAGRRRELCDLILADAGLCLAVLEEANRGLEGLAVPVATVDVALQTLGDATLGRVVRRARDASPTPVGRWSLERFRHNLMVGLASASLAELLGQVDPETARVAGVLHDVGLVGPDDGPDIGEGPLRDHQQEGFEILMARRIPARIASAVSRHHGAPAAHLVRESESDLTAVVRLAEHLTGTLGGGLPGDAPSESAAQPLPPRLQGMAARAHEPVARAIGDGLLVLGISLGIPKLTVDSFIEECRHLLGRKEQPVQHAAGLPPAFARILEGLHNSDSEGAALLRLMGGIRALPGVERALLVFEETGEAVLGKQEGETPFYVRARDLAAFVEGGADLMTALRGDASSLLLDGTEGTTPVLQALKAPQVLAMPLSAGSKHLGMVLVAASGGLEGLPGPFDTLAHAVGDILERLQLARTSFLLTERMTKDDLTDVLQRAHFLDLMEGRVRAANRYHRSLALVMLDVDHFKAWNDRHGHAVGDRMLKEVSRVLRDCSRDSDLVGRYGGDEFLVLLPESTAEGAKLYAERVRARVESLGAVMNEACYDLPLTVSVGVACPGDQPLDADTLLLRADHALYRAKQRGRNTVCVDHG